MISTSLNTSGKNKQTLLLAIILLFATLYANAQEDDDAVKEPVEIETSGKFRPKYFDEDPDSFTFRKIPDDVVRALKKDEAFWYADSSFKKNKTKEEARQSNSSSKGNGKKNETYRTSKEDPVQAPQVRWLSTPVLVVILVLFLGIIAWYLLKNNVVGRKRIAANDELPLEEHEDIFAINYQRDIDNAIRDKNYRLAIRLLFLRLLRDLSDKKIIDYKQDRTNFEYLSQLYKSSYYNDFFKITRSYEYAWYGKFDVSTEAFGAIKNDFDNLDRKLS